MVRSKNSTGASQAARRTSMRTRNATKPSVRRGYTRHGCLAHSVIAARGTGLMWQERWSTSGTPSLDEPTKWLANTNQSVGRQWGRPECHPAGRRAGGACGQCKVRERGFRGVILTLDGIRWGYAKLVVSHPQPPAQPRSIQKSAKLANVCYDIRGPVLARARSDGGRGPPHHQAQHRQPRALRLRRPRGAGAGRHPQPPERRRATATRRAFSPRGRPSCTTRSRSTSPASTIEDIYIGNGVSELIVMCMQGSSTTATRCWCRRPTIRSGRRRSSLAGGTARHYLCDEGSGWLPDLDDIRAKITPTHAGDRRHQPQQPDRRALSRRSAARARRDRARSTG